MDTNTQTSSNQAGTQAPPQPEDMGYQKESPTEQEARAVGDLIERIAPTVGKALENFGKVERPSPDYVAAGAQVPEQDPQVTEAGPVSQRRTTTMKTLRTLLLTTLILAALPSCGTVAGQVATDAATCAGVQLGQDLLAQVESAAGLSTSALADLGKKFGIQAAGCAAQAVLGRLTGGQPAAAHAARVSAPNTEDPAKATKVRNLQKWLAQVSKPVAPGAARGPSASPVPTAAATPGAAPPAGGAAAAGTSPTGAGH